MPLLQLSGVGGMETNLEVGGRVEPLHKVAHQTFDRKLIFFQQVPSEAPSGRQPDFDGGLLHLLQHLLAAVFQFVQHVVNLFKGCTKWFHVFIRRALSVRRAR